MNTNQEENVCPICLAEPGEDLGLLVAGGDDPECQKHHLFHKECINELIYIQHINKCPVCRRRCIPRRGATFVSTFLSRKKKEL